MKLRLSILLLAAALAAAPAAGQTIKSLGYNTTNGQIVYSGTNTLTFTNSSVIFSNIQLGIFGFGSDTGFVGRNSGGLFTLYGTNVSSSVPAFYGWSGSQNTAFSAGTARTNLGLGATNYPTFRGFELLNSGDEMQINGTSINSVTFGGVLSFEEQQLSQEGATVFAWDTNSFAVTPSATFATNVSIAGSLSVGSLTTTTPSTWALDATQTAAATNGVLTLPSNANVIRLTNNNAISSVTNGVLGAFYYLVNQATNAVTISNVGGITIDGAQNLTLSPNESATLVATGPTNVSVAARGDLTDVALGGTANTAPSQTASSGSSLMTRDLGDLRLFGQLALVQLVTPNMGSVYNTNGAGGSPNVNGFDMTTSTNSASSSFYSGVTALKQTLAGTGANTVWNGRVVAGWTMNRYGTNNEVRMQLGRNTGTQAHGPLTNRGIGIRVNGDNMFFEAHDGTTHFETTNAVALTHGSGGTDIFWAVAQSGVLRFYRGESTLLATVTNNVPTTVVGENDAWSISISNTSSTASGFRVYSNPGFILQQ
jgi:hypothetical protein